MDINMLKEIANDADYRSYKKHLERINEGLLNAASAGGKEYHHYLSDLKNKYVDLIKDEYIKKGFKVKLKSHILFGKKCEMVFKW